jgi:VWFA-related protein
MWRSAPFTVLASLAALCPPSPSQESAAPPRLTIRTESREVLVDAVVRDKKGKLVRDLGSGDFRVWDDGKEQAVTSFSVESPGVAPEKAQKHYLLLLFDNTSGSHTNLIAARRDTARFISAFAGPDRYMAVATFNGSLGIAQNFTLNPAPLESAIGRMGDAAASTEIPKSENAQLQQTVPAPLGRTPAGTGKVAAGTAAARSTLPDSPMAEAQPSENSSYLRRNLFQAVGALAQSMASIRGRKSLVLIGFGGTDSPDPTSLSLAIAACNRANVAVYVMNQPGLKAMAEETGGRVLVRANDLAGDLGKVAEEQDEHYVLGYTPAESAHDCHALRVAVNRPGVEVRARQGYCMTRPVLPTSADTGHAVEARTASSPGNMTASMLLPYFYAAPNIAKVNVAMEIAAAAIPFSKVKGKPHGELSLSGIAYKPDGEAGGRFSDLVNLDFENDKEVEDFRKHPLHYEYQFDLPPGQYTLRVAFSAGAQNFGKAEAPLSIEAWDGRRFAMSALALAKESRPVADLASALEDSLLEDRRPLIARSVQIVPSGSNRFRSSEPCRWYAEIYAPQTSGSAPSIQVRILDRETGRPLMDSGVIGVADFVHRGSPVIPVALDVPVRLLAPGSYLLEVKAVDSASGASALRTTDFEVER